MNEHPTVSQSSAKSLSSSDVSLFCSQVVLLLRAGIPLQEGIGAMSENIDTPKGKELLHRIQTGMEQNHSLYLALNSTGAFPNYMINMINIGEKAGKLESVLDALSLYYDRDDRLRSRIRSALLYPFILILMMGAVISVLVIKVLPIFDAVFMDMGSDMSAASATILHAGTVIGKIALIAIIVLSVFLLCALILYKTEKGYQWISTVLNNFPLTRRLSDKISSARFASAMSLLLSSGYDTSEALELIPNILTSKLMIGKLHLCREAVDSGAAFSKALADVHLFPGIYSSMIGIGAKTGNLDTVMSHLADIYAEDVDESVNRAVSFIEPAMVAILSIVIGAILLSVMLPLMGIMSSIG